jgi:hypothetical protein
VISDAPDYEPVRIQGKLVRKSKGLYDEDPVTGDKVQWPVLDLLHFKNHFYYIKDINKFCNSWRCQRCGKYFNHRGSCMRHQQNCSRKQKKIYPGGGFTRPEDVFGKLRRLGIRAEDSEGRELSVFFEHRMSFDFESRMQDLHSRRGRNLKYTKRHIPMSVSVRSTYNGVNRDNRKCNEVQHFRNADPKKLVEEFCAYINEVAELIGNEMERDYGDLLKQVEDKAKVARAALKDRRLLSGDEKIAANQRYHANRQYMDLEKQLRRWIYQVPVIGYNSGKFDLNLIRRFLLPCLVSNDNRVDNIIEKGTDFMSLGTQRLVFLDMMHYVPPNMNLASFIKTFHYGDLEMAKGWWCYEYIDDYSRLNERGPPPIGAFKSTLKNTEMSQEEYDQFLGWWHTHNFETLGDLLKYYNEMDVGPFLDAINNMFKIFKDLGIDIFKRAISLPGVAQIRMFSKQKPWNVLAFFNEWSKHWQHLFKVSVNRSSFSHLNSNVEIWKKKKRRKIMVKRSSNVT